MKYRVMLQRYDELEAEVAASDSREFALQAALLTYQSMLPAFTHASSQRLMQLRKDQPEYAHDFTDTVPNRMRGAEWNLAVYERVEVPTPDDPERETKDEDRLIAFIGPSLEVPTLR